jgi:hypothetical protein
MGIAYRIDEKLGATLVAWADVVTGEQFLAHVGRLSSDPRWPPAARLHLTDLRMASLDSSLDDATIEKAAELYGRHRQKIENMKVAIVAGKAFERAAVFERVLERHGATVIVFNFLDTARKWLNLDGSEVERAMHELNERARGTPA